MNKPCRPCIVTDAPPAANRYQRMFLGRAAIVMTRPLVRSATPMAVINAIIAGVDASAHRRDRNETADPWRRQHGCRRHHRCA